MIIIVFLCVHLTTTFLIYKAAPYPTDLDEHQHLSYALHMVQNPSFFADFPGMYEVDQNDLSAFTGPKVRLKHPTFYYFMIGLFADPVNLSLQENAKRLRLANVAVSFLAVLILLVAGATVFREPEQLFAYTAVVALCPKIGVLGGMINNDNLALLGAAITTLGLAKLMRGRPTMAIALLIGGGFAIGALAKLTAGLILGFMVLFVHVIAVRKIFPLDRAKTTYLLCILVFVAVGVSQYVVNVYLYGSPIYPPTGREPIPETERILLDPWHYLRWFLFVIGERWATFRSDAGDYISLFLVMSLSILGTWHGMKATAQDPFHKRTALLAAISLISAVIILAINYGVAYRGHLETGYLSGMHFRYYLPAWGGIAMGAALGLAAIPAGGWRKITLLSLLGFLFYSHTVPLVANILSDFF